MSDFQKSNCPFCIVPAARVLESNDLAVVIEDAFPVTAGHSLIVSRRHVRSFFDLQAGEIAAIMALLCRVRARFGEQVQPDGYNIGVNDGPAAGQTIMHVHVHLIPRRSGDVADPTGGVRSVIPGRGPYLRADG